MCYSKLKRINSITASSISKLKISYKKLLPFKTYFEHLYFKAKKFVEKNKNENFIKNFNENKKICLQKILEQEDDFLFNCK